MLFQSHSPRGASCCPLAEMAQILLRLPCGQAAVEWAFSVLKHILGLLRRSMKPDLLDAILAIRSHRVETPEKSRGDLASLAPDAQLQGVRIDEGVQSEPIEDSLLDQRPRVPPAHWGAQNPWTVFRSNPVPFRRP